MANREPIQYENRLIAFVDLLGFKQAVNNSVNHQVIAQKIYNILNYHNRLKEKNYGDGLASGSDYGKEITFFSDCFVISYAIGRGGELNYLLSDVIFHALDLTSIGFLVRGGITFGQLVHQGDICFGPAMNRAYELESICARYPRILVDDVIINNISAFRPECNSEEFERKFMFKLISRDKDGKYFLNYIKQNSYFDDYVYYQNYLKYMRDFLICNLQQYQNDERVVKKYRRYKEYYNEVIKQQIKDDYQNLFLIK